MIAQQIAMSRYQQQRQNLPRKSTKITSIATVPGRDRTAVCTTALHREFPTIIVPNITGAAGVGLRRRVAISAQCLRGNATGAASRVTPVYKTSGDGD